MSDKMYRLFLLFIILASSVAAQVTQKEIIDVSPDGKTVSKYNASSASALGTVVEHSVDIPFGTSPDWTGALERQIGGMAFADYDGDGDLDLGTGCYFSNSYPPVPYYEVLIYRNDNGVLTTNPAWISSDQRSTTDIKFADVNNDGRIDLLACNGDNSFAPSVLYMNSAGGLSVSPSWVASPFAWSVGACFGDADGDGDLDIAFANQGNSVIPTKPIYIFYNNNGTYNTSPDWSSVDQMITNTAAFGDVNNSRVVSTTESFTANGTQKVFHLSKLPLCSIDTVYVNQIPTDQFCFDKIGGWVSLSSANSPGDVVKVAYTHVSRGDLATSKWVNYSSGVYFFQNGSLTTTLGWTTNITTGQKGIVWDDFDADGFADIAIGGSGIPIYMYKNNNGVLNPNPVWASTSVSPSSQELISGDLDNDGFPELACVHFSSKRIEVYKNRRGILDSAPTWLYIAGTSATSIAFGDVNGDGRLDLAVGTARTPVVVFLNQLAPVPVEFTSFYVRDAGDYNELNWTTATETNNRGFYIEKSMDKLMWSEIGFVSGSGNSTSEKSYSFVDAGTFKNVFYRLRQVDYNGKYQFSKEIESSSNADAGIIVGVPYPNPLNENSNLVFRLSDAAAVKIEMLSILGSKVKNICDGKYGAGSHNIKIDRANLESGVYLLKITAGTQNIIRKLIIMK